MINQIIMILLISILVLVHELGHYIAAVANGVRVTRFGIGMPIGPSLKLFKLGHTTFYIHAFLFGGYVSFADDAIIANKDKDEDKKDINEDEVLPSNSPELYENKTILQKFIIVSAGVFMNLIFGLLLVILASAIYHRLPANTQNIYVDNFTKEITSNIQEYKINKSDRFLKVNNQDIDTFYAFIFYTTNSKMFDDYAQEDLIEKNTAEIKKLNPSIKDTIKEGQIIYLPPIYPESPLEVNKNVVKGLEKYKKTGIKLDQNQISIRNSLINLKSNKKGRIYKAENDISINDLTMALSDTYKPISFTLLDKNNKQYTIEDVKVGTTGRLGLLLRTRENIVETKTFKSIIVNSFKYTYSTTVTMLKGLLGLILGKVSASDMHGIIAIVKIGGDIIASKGMLNGLLLTAMISINLAIINFLPIPALDGGHVMFLIIEKLTGKKPTVELAEKINSFFFVLLIVLMILICYNDIFALITRKF